MVKEFKPYSDLWITSNKWFKNIEVWMNGKFEELDAPGCEKFVEEATKTFAVVSRFFRDKGIEPVLKIATAVKS